MTTANSFLARCARILVPTLLGLPLVGALGAGCIAQPAGDDDVSSLDSAISASSAVSRAEEWVKAKLHYCQSPNHARDYDSACSTYCERTDNAAWNPYRSDCSGLVSWAWGLAAPGRITTELAPFKNDITHTISASSLEAGDAANSSDHIILFKSWVVHGEEATFIEEPGCSSSEPYAHEFTSKVSISGDSIYVDYEGKSFTAIRYDGITHSGSPPPPPPPPGTSCTVEGVAGTCELNSTCKAKAGHVSTPGFCPGPADIECCTAPPKCKVNGVEGLCMEKSVCAGLAGHHSTPGYCPGPANEECCLP